MGCLRFGSEGASHAGSPRSPQGQLQDLCGFVRRSDGSPDATRQFSALLDQVDVARRSHAHELLRPTMEVTAKLQCQLCYWGLKKVTTPDRYRPGEPSALEHVDVGMQSRLGRWQPVAREFAPSECIAGSGEVQLD